MLTAVLAAAVIAFTAGQGAAQGCIERTGAGSASSRDAALRAAFGTMLQATDPNAVRAWNAAGQRIGEAPGYTITKMRSSCSPGGEGQTCRVVATLCKI